MRRRHHQLQSKDCCRFTPSSATQQVQGRCAARLTTVMGLLMLGLLTTSGGCVSCTGTPVSSLNRPDLVTACEGKLTVDLGLLQTPPNAAYLVDSGDTLGIYVRDAFGSGAVPGPVNSPILANARYPGQIPDPQLGIPLKVNEQGQVRLPDIPPINASGLTLTEIADQIRHAYIRYDILKEGKAYVSVTLIKPRTVRVTVFREDVDTTVPTQVRKDAYLLTKRGTAQVLEMPGGENDVLHALAASGGLPGTDAYNHVWVIRAHPHLHNWVQDGFAQHPPSESALEDAGVRFVRIPLEGCPCEDISITPDMVELHDGDVVYIEGRKTEFFYVGGLLTGGQIPLPRDYDLDILGAIAVANGNVLGPTGNNSNNFVAGPGNVLPPTRALVSRKSPDGALSLIEVDLRRALHDPRERLIIRPGDVVMLKYRFHELLGNIGLNIVNFNYAIPGGD